MYEDNSSYTKKRDHFEREQDSSTGKRQKINQDNEKLSINKNAISDATSSARKRAAEIAKKLSNLAKNSQNELNYNHDRFKNNKNNNSNNNSNNNRSSYSDRNTSSNDSIQRNQSQQRPMNAAASKLSAELQERIAASKAKISSLKNNISQTNLPLNKPYLNDTKNNTTKNSNLTTTEQNYSKRKPNKELDKNELAKKKQRDMLLGVNKSYYSKDSRSNNYYDPHISLKNGERRPRQFNFVQKGSIVRKAEEQRKNEKMEELKRRILETSKQTGLSADVGFNESAYKLPEPPAIEPWDKLLTGKSSYKQCEPFNEFPFTDESLSTQDPDLHLIPPFWESKESEPKPLYLTRKELKRIRKLERAQKYKETQDRIRLGLDPAPPPKVKLSNLMSVLTNEAIQDPTAVEVRVRKEVQDRRLKHENENKARQLTKEERLEKKNRKEMNDSFKELHCAVFKIKELSDGYTRTRVKLNAEQLGLTGVVVLNSEYNLVIAEGSQRNIRKYKNLLLNRIKWFEHKTTEDSPATDDEYDSEEEMEERRNDKFCKLIWEGQLKERQYRSFFVKKRIQSKKQLNGLKVLGFNIGF